MTPEQIQFVQSSWRAVTPVADEAAALFYGRLFRTDPSARSLFTNDMPTQGARLMDMITVAVKGLDRPQSLLPTLEALGRRHAGYGVRDEHYACVGAALLWTLERKLGAAFTEEVREAWTLVYGRVAAVMQAAAREAVAA